MREVVNGASTVVDFFDNFSLENTLGLVVHIA